MTDAKKSRARIVLGLGIALVAIGLGAIAYIPRSDPTMVAISATTTMLGYLLGRWAVNRMTSGGDS